MSSEPVGLWSIDDLSLDRIDALLDRARELRRGGLPIGEREPFVVALVFLAPSLRTRVGFAAATARLGGTTIDVHEQRDAPTMSAPESLSDTLRTVSGAADVLVVRTGGAIARSALAGSVACPYVNAGNGEHDHPTQTLIDLLAIERRGPVADLRIGLCGDLGMRGPRSMIRFLDRRPPAELVLIAPPGRDDPGVEIGAELCARTTRRAHADFSGLDVLYVGGLPPGSEPGALDHEARARFALDERNVATLADDAVVLSPMPVIDEIAPGVRDDPRVRIWEQSDDGVPVRMAVLEALRAGEP